LIGKIINLIRERAEEVKVRQSAQISPDLDDNALCVCAEQGNADSIVTLNMKDFPQDRLKARVSMPVDFLTHR
jgi:predicted nucleic acid-binding protein